MSNNGFGAVLSIMALVLSIVAMLIGLVSYSANAPLYVTCPAGQVLTSSSGCSNVTTETVASCSTTQVAQNETAAGAFQCANRPLYTIYSALTSCTDTTSGAAVMGGFKLSYTTSSTTLGGVVVGLMFQITAPSVAIPPITTTVTVRYNTGTAPNCNASVPLGSGICGRGYVYSQPAVSVQDKFAGVFTCALAVGALSRSTTYWFDISIVDSTTDGWIFATPGAYIMDVTP